MMQEDINQRTVTLLVNTGKMTGKVFLQAIQKYLVIQRQIHQEKEREKITNPAYRGRMSIKALMKDRGGLSNIEIHDEHIQYFERVARKYRIEYAIKKEVGENNTHYLVFFRGKDTDILQVAFNEFVKKRLKVQERLSIREKLQALKTKHKQLQKLPEKVQKREIAR